MKIGIYSGTFDPVHDGHKWFIESAIEKLGLDRVYLLIEKEPRHKSGYSAYKDRLEMAKLAFADNKKVSVDDLDIQKSGQNQTVEGTMKAIRHDTGDSAEVWLMMGGDVFEYVPNWEGYESLIESVGFYVALRTEDDGEIAVELMSSDMSGAKVKLVASEHANLSSTKVRDSIANNEEVKSIDEKVLDYAKSQRLYE